MQTTVSITFEGCDLTAIAQYEYYPGQPGITHLQPEYCQEPIPESVEITSLDLINCPDGSDINWALEIDEIRESLEMQILDKLQVAA